jgi:hypothetical protein
MEKISIRRKPASLETRLTDARTELLAREWGTGELSFNHQVLAQVALPYRRNSDVMNTYERSSGSAYVRVSGGEVPDGFGGFRKVGVPYGPKSRLILILLSSLAVKNQSPEIPIDHSFRSFCKSCGVTLSGSNHKQMKEQLLRLSACSMRLSIDNYTTTSVFQGYLFSQFDIQIPVDDRQQFLWNTRVKFSQEFYESLEKNAVPLERDAILALKHSARAMDIYMWLAATLFRRKRRQTIRWTSLRFQFGDRRQDMNGFKRAFKAALKQALYVYPDAKVDIIEGGIALYPSKPPIPTKEMRLLGG